MIFFEKALLSIDTQNGPFCQGVHTSKAWRTCSSVSRGHQSWITNIAEQIDAGKITND